MVLEILTPEKKLFSGDASSVTLPGIDGQFQLLNNHAPIISALGKGNIKYKTTEGEKQISRHEKAGHGKESGAALACMLAACHSPSR